MFKKTLLLLAIISIPLIAQPASANSHASSLKNLGMSEIMFAQSMIPHHEQAVELSKIALKNSTNAKVKKLATNIITGQAKEISQMKFWLTANKASTQMDHDMGAMDGMLSAREIGKLKTLSGVAFDRAFLKGMIAHHKGALEMLGLLEGTKNSEAKALSLGIRKAQSGEISKITLLLSRTS
jgi:uncharacterized protein (DUF305 family)